MDVCAERQLFDRQPTRSAQASNPRPAGRSAAYNRAVMAKRSYGSGRLFVYKDKAGKESWYGSWRAGTRRVQRKIGPKRTQGGTSGLTLVQAEGRVRVADNFTRGKFDSPKSHEGRSVPMADRLARELKLHSQRSAYRTDDDLVFCHPHTGNVLDPSKMRKRFGEAIARAGVREITFHELRHTFGTQMAAAGAPLRAIQEWMGHADAKTTEIYRHYAPDPTNGAQLVERAFSTTQPSVPNESPTREQAR